MSKSLYKRYSRVGPGGMNCPCCGPAPGKDRKFHMRLWKRQERQSTIKEIVKECNDKF